jgi:hypothetical protein
MDCFLFISQQKALGTREKIWNVVGFSALLQPHL